MSTDRDDHRSNPPPRSVALFIDWDNFAIGLRQEMPDRAADVGPILRWSRRFGILTVCRAYGEWREPNERLAIYNAGVEVVYAPVLPLGGSVLARAGGGAKSLADTAMAVDVTDLLNLMPTITTVILATSDKDLIPVLRFAQRRGLHAIVVGSDRTAGALRELADEFISYRQLLDHEGVGPSPLSRPVTVPPVRYPRAPRIGGMLPPPPVEDDAVRRPRRAPMRASSAPLRASAGSVFQQEESVAAPPIAAISDINEEEETPESAERRRRRGGRRRRGREVNGAPSSASMDATTGDADDSDTNEEAAILESVIVDAGSLASGGADAVAEAEASQPEPLSEEADAPAPDAVVEGDLGPPEVGIGSPQGFPPSMKQPVESIAVESVMQPRDAPVSTGSTGRGPIVLPGEKLRRFVPQVVEPSAPAAGAPAPGAEPPVSSDAARPPTSTEEPVAPQADPDVADGSASPSSDPSRAARVRRRGSRGGRGAASTGGTDATSETSGDSNESPDSASSDGESDSTADAATSTISEGTATEEASEGPNGTAEPAAKAAVKRPSAPRRRGSRGR